MNNPYDHAYQLAKALSESVEYKGFLEGSEKLRKSPETLKQVQEFFKKQMEFELKAMAGEKPTDAEMKSIEDLYRLIQLHPEGSHFLESQMRYQRLMADVMKIINDSVSEGNKILTEKM